MSPETSRDMRSVVREAYGRVAESSGSCCGPTSCGCGPSVGDVALSHGYSEEDLRKAPEGSNLGLGCGNPLAQAALQPGEVVVDLGSGAGFDAFLAAEAVGPDGRVIGVDMTPQMLEKARGNAAKTGRTNVEFRQGYIESLPLGDGIADALISNCVINLSPDKPAVFREAYRVLREGGRIVVSDIVLRGALPEAIRGSAEAYCGCVAGASQVEDYVEAIRKAGFEQVEILEDGGIDPETLGGDPVTDGLLASVDAATIEQTLAAVRHLVVRARKPAKED
jgi:arsenite methyltransferase